MKNIKKLLIILVILISGMSLIAQSAAVTSTASAKIYDALTLTQVTPLSFGSMTSPTTPATVLVSTNGIRTIGTGTIALLGQSPVATSGLYVVTGTENATYVITLPSGDIPITNGSSIMNVSNFVALTTNVPNSTTGTLISGIDQFGVGATLNLSANQIVGLYSGSFGVSVNYN